MFYHTEVNNLNESTFEAKAHQEIKRIFPNYLNLSISHQLIFSVKLGHDDILIKPNIKRPRLDILLKHKDRNLTVLELKNPLVHLREDDRTQGLSYARLLVPMPPLVIVSNGKETKFFETITGSSIEFDTPDEKQIEALFTQALHTASINKDQAIQTLLGKDPEVWNKVLNELTSKGFKNQIGEIDDLSEPIVKSFNLPRSSTKRLAKLVKGNNSLVAVTGPKLIGKTNVVFEFCQVYARESSIVPLYINADDCHSGIFQYISNHFTKRYFKSFTKEDIRHWFLNVIMSKPHPAGKMVLIIDGVDYSRENIIREINEIIDFCSSESACSLIICCDDRTCGLLSQKSGSPKKTLFGKKAICVEVKELDGTEFKEANDYIINNWSIGFLKGASYSKEFRNPRILRQIISHTHKDGIQIIPGYFPFHALKWVLEGFKDEEFKRDMFKLVSSLFKDPETIIETMVSYGRGYVSCDQAEKILGDVRIQRLLEQGHLNWFTDNEQNQYLAPKTPEVLAATAVEVLLKVAEKMDIDTAIKNTLKICERLPYGDIIAANVFERLGNKTFSLFNILSRLLNNPPVIEKVNNQQRLALYTDKEGLIELPEEVINLTIEDGGNTTSNIFPWLVLSQLATLPLISENAEDPWFVYREILINLGSYKNLLIRFENKDIRDLKGYPTHSVRNDKGEEGIVLCGEVGIIEPITFALLLAFSICPNEIIKISKYAIKHKDPFLKHRLQNAANNLKKVDNDDLKETANQVLLLLNKKDLV